MKTIFTFAALALGTAAAAQVGPVAPGTSPSLTTPAPATGVDSRGDRARTGRDAVRTPGTDSTITGATPPVAGPSPTVPTVPPPPGTSVTGDGSVPAPGTPGTAGTPPR